MRAAALMLLLSLVACQSVEMPPPAAARKAAMPATPVTLERVVRQFEATVFGTDPDAILLRRTAPMSLAIAADDPDVQARHATEVAEHFGLIQRLTGISVAAAGDVGDADLRIVFLPRRFFPDLYRSGRDGAEPDCSTVLFRDDSRPGVIAAAGIAIGTDLPDARRRHCIIEEMVQSMGLPYDACEYAPSAFCDDGYDGDLTRADEALVRALYDPRISPGLSRTEAIPIVSQILRELLPLAGS